MLRFIRVFWIITRKWRFFKKVIVEFPFSIFSRRSISRESKINVEFPMYTLDSMHGRISVIMHAISRYLKYENFLSPHLILRCSELIHKMNFNFSMKEENLKIQLLISACEMRSELFSILFEWTGMESLRKYDLRIILNGLKNIYVNDFHDNPFFSSIWLFKCFMNSYQFVFIF